MRLLTEMEARYSTEYQQEYHGKLRGFVYGALKGAPYDIHDHEIPAITFSNPFKINGGGEWWRQIKEGDVFGLNFASPVPGIIREVASHLQENPEVNIGEMAFRVSDVNTIHPDVGPPGSEGVLRTETGVLARTPPQFISEVAPEREGQTRVCWEPDHGMAPFERYVTDQLQRKWERFGPEGVPGPADVDEPLFTGYDLQKVYGLDLAVSEDYNEGALLSKWELEYRIRDAAHRQHLNLALNLGLGGRTSMGLGFLNIKESDQGGSA